MQNLAIVGYHVNEVLRRVPPHVQREDLAAAGSLALVQAARAYDPATGVPFGRYAALRVRGALVDELRSMDWASRGARRRARELADISDQLTAELGRTPTREELAEAMGAEVADIDATRSETERRLLSLEGFDGVNAISVPDSAPSPEEAVLTGERVRYLHAAVDVLPERLRYVIEQLFFHDRPVIELAEELGVTHSRISQLRTEALGMLRAGMHANLDPELLPTEITEATGIVARRRQAYFAAVAERAASSAAATAAATLAAISPASGRTMPHEAMDITA